MYCCKEWDLPTLCCLLGINYIKEVVKMSKGKWTRHTHLFEKDEYECSVCHETFDKPSAVCPKCGTKMKSSVKYDASWVDEMADYDSMFGDDD